MIEFWKIFFSSVGGAGAVVAVCIWPLKIFLQKKIEAGYQKVIDENKIRFSWYYSEKAKVIKELYEKLSKLSKSILLLNSVHHEPSPNGRNYEDEKMIQVVAQHCVSFTDSAQGSAIFFDDEFNKKIIKINNIASNIMCNRSLEKNKTEREESILLFEKEFEPLKVELRNKFREILNGTDCEVSDGE